jgi:electron transfer flavoprotein beta subunit
VRIVVCIKQVPTVAELRIEEGRWTLAREGVPSRIDTYDLHALEVALTFRDLHGGHVIALSMGPPKTEEALREAMAMGADQGILLSDPALAGSDTLATSTALAQAIRRLGPPPDLVLCGARSSDSGTGQVGPQLAEDLGIPHVAYVERAESEDETLRVQRRVDRYRETLRVRLPALLTILRSRRPPRDIPLGEIEEAFERKDVQCWDVEKLGLEHDRVGLAGSATWVRQIREPEGTRRVRMVQGNTQEAMDAIVQALTERYVLD